MDMIEGYAPLTWIGAFLNSPASLFFMKRFGVLCRPWAWHKRVNSWTRCSLASSPLSKIFKSFRAFVPGLILHSLQDHPGPVSQEFLTLPGHEVPKESDIADGGFGPGHMAKTRESPQWVRTE